MLTCEFSNEVLVSVRLFASKLVIEVSDKEHNAQLVAQFEQHAQQSNRIRTAGNGDRDAVPRLQQLAFADVLENLFAHGMMVKL